MYFEMYFKRTQVARMVAMVMTLTLLLGNRGRHYMAPQGQDRYVVEVKQGYSKRPKVSTYSSYTELQRCQLTFAGVERFFLMLGKMLRKDKPFLLGNVEKYLCTYIFHKIFFR